MASPFPSNTKAFLALSSAGPRTRTESALRFGDRCRRRLRDPVKRFRFGRCPSASKILPAPTRSPTPSPPDRGREEVSSDYEERQTRSGQRNGSPLPSLLQKSPTRRVRSKSRMVPVRHSTACLPSARSTAGQDLQAYLHCRRIRALPCVPLCHQGCAEKRSQTTPILAR